MDAFGTAVTAGTLVLTYLDACASYSSEARSLYHRFKWDLRVMKEIATYLENLQPKTPNFQTEDDDLLNETADYLAVLFGKVSSSFTKIQASGILRQTINQGLWVARRSSLKELEQELNQWTNRFEVRLLGLPPEIKTIIPFTPTTISNDASTTHVLESNSRMQKFASLTTKAKEQQITSLMREPPRKLLQAIKQYPHSTTLVIRVQSQQFIITSRPFPPDIIPGTEEFQRFTSDIGELAAALHVLDPTTNIPLLRVEYFFYDVHTKRFFFVQVPTHPVNEVLTLDEMIDKAPFPYMLIEKNAWLPLNQRLKLAQKIAEAVFFLHTAGFVHKNITSSSIISLQRSNAAPSDLFPYSMGEPYLVGFDVVRSETGISLLEGAYNLNRPSRQQIEPIAKRNKQVFQHPDRLQEAESKIKRYIRNYDIYSLGVVLLQIGIWEPISKVTMRLEDDLTSWPESLRGISQELGLITGARYQKVVAWCLGLKGDRLVKDVEFAQKVLDPLEDMANALA
ncbi:hypothetical protein F4804DRAFT_351835 [Jackrogersella minutella]|nr:hypothetical protein F4804DRAFT_351835 [Jackrogersella minutella]